MSRLRGSRVFEVKKERVRVETEMIAKYNRRFANIREYQARREDFDTVALAILRTPIASREVSTAEERGTPLNDNDTNLALVPSEDDPEVEAADPEQQVADTGAPVVPTDGQPAVLLSSDTSVDGQEEDRGTEVNEGDEQEGATEWKAIPRATRLTRSRVGRIRISHRNSVSIPGSRLGILTRLGLIEWSSSYFP
ncbi:hypothetical protein Bca4012_083856 [Brassica carinata]